MKDIKANLELYKRYYNAFRHTFRANLKEFWIDNKIGFNAMKFSDFLNVPEDISLGDYLYNEYGQEAHDIIYSLVMGA